MTLVFCRTKQTVDALTGFLKRKGIEANAIHGDLHQGKRNKVMSKLRGGELSVLVASDLAARGIDVEDISHVVNYDLPEDPEVYVHRIGRTARAGRKGIAWSFVTPEQGDLLTNIEKLTNVEITKADYDDFEPGPVPPAVLDERKRAEERRELAMADHSRTAQAPPSAQETADPTQFPGGLVPTALPAKRMGGRLRTRRR
jgi:superfamily II DNA/RNA helicase